jgi:hypothetical protein
MHLHPHERLRRQCFSLKNKNWPVWTEAISIQTSLDALVELACPWRCSAAERMSPRCDVVKV